MQSADQQNVPLRGSRAALYGLLAMVVLTGAVLLMLARDALA